MKNDKKVFSPQHNLYLKKLKKEKYFVLSMQILLFLVIIGLWELLTATKIMDPFFVSSPSRIITKIGQMFASGESWIHIGTTLYETLLGFILATGIGTFIAMLLWFFPTLRKILSPFIIVLNALPKIALGPIPVAKIKPSNVS